MFAQHFEHTLQDNVAESLQRDSHLAEKEFSVVFEIWLPRSRFSMYLTFSVTWLGAIGRKVPEKYRWKHVQNR